MDINRKTYSGIIKLLKGKDISSDDALDLADDICLLLEKVEIKEQNPQANKFEIKPDTTSEPRKFKPYEKVVGGQVDGKGKFHPIPAGPARGGIRDDSGKIVEI